MGEYTLADIMRITGAKRRTVQFWADHGVVRADKATQGAGTGVHRRFPRSEAIIACIAQAFALKGLNVEVLGDVANAMREFHRRQRTHEGWDILESVIEDGVPAYLILTCTSKDAWGATIYEPPLPDIVEKYAPLLQADQSMVFVIALNKYLGDFNN